MKPPIIYSTAAVTALLLLAQAAAQGVEWSVWVNPRTDYMWDIGIEVYPVPIYWYADEDGGYTMHIYFKAGPKIWWNGRQVDYHEDYAVLAHLIVATWNASLRFAAENYEWGRHLLKLRLKFYTSANLSKAPYVDVVIDPTKEPCPGSWACTHLKKPMEIHGNLIYLPHEIGHALGLGHSTMGVWAARGHDWRGWPVGGLYPAGTAGPAGLTDYKVVPGYHGPPDTFVLYALSEVWSSLKNATPGSRIEFPGKKVIYYRNVKDRLGPLYSEPGVVWAYPYSVLKEDSLELPIPSPFITHVSEGLYDGDLCMSLPAFKDARLPVVRDYGNHTALVLHGLDLQAAIIDRRMTPFKTTTFYVLYMLPLKHLNEGLLEDLLKRGRNEPLIVVYDGLGPAWDRVSGVSYRGDRICLEKLRERVLVEAWLGRAYRVDAGMAEAVSVEGWSYRDDDGNNWVLRGSMVYFRPLNSTYSPSEGVKHVWRGVNTTVRVDGPLTGGELIDRLWKRQYLVEVDSPYSFEGVGWFDEGVRASPKPTGWHVDLGNGTRLILKGFEGFNGTETVVDRPLKLRPVWERMYRVDTVSRYVFSEAGKFFGEGDELFILMPRVHDFGNGTRVELLNITAYGPHGEMVGAWDGKLGGGDYGLLQLTVDRPLELIVSWNLYHRLTVASPVNSYEAWVLNGTVHRLNLPEKRLLGQDVLMVLRQVSVNGRPHQGVELAVTSPTFVEAEYQRRLLTTLMVDAGGGYLVEPYEVVLERDGEVEVYRPPFTYVGEGTWRVVRVSYLGGEITADATIEVNIAGMKTIPSRLRAVEVAVVDLLGIPIPYTAVRAENTGGMTGISGTMTLHAVPPWDFEAITYHILGSGKAVIRPGETSARITAGVSPYTLVLLAAVAAAGVVVWRRKVLRR